MILPGQEGMRFVVQAIEGYSIAPGGTASNRLSTSYAVLDRLDCYRERGTWSAWRAGKSNDYTRRTAAFALRDRLERECARA